MNLQQLASPESLAGVHHAITARTGGEKLSALEADFIARDGHRVAMEMNSRLQFRNGLPVGMLCIARDISQRKRVERLEDNRREVLEMVAQNQPLDAVLGRVEQMIEHYFPGTVARIRLTDGSAAPECALGRNDRGKRELPRAYGRSNSCWRRPSLGKPADLSPRTMAGHRIRTDPHGFQGEAGIHRVGT
jgi:hypothetical protein